MKVLVSDTSVLIDLERGGLLELAFSCGLTMAVPDLLYERELEAVNGAFLRSLGLGVVALTPDEVNLAQGLRTELRGLSLPDAFALVYALRPGHMLLTGDKLLRTEAERRKCMVAGVLWLLDRMEESGQVSLSALREGLTRISEDSRCRLPKAEVRARLARY